MYIRFNASFLPVLPNIWWGNITSGTTYEVGVTYWGPVGTYTIGVQAKDAYDSESEWAYVQLNITKSKTIIPSFLQFLKNHPNLFPILQKLIYYIT